MKERGQFLSRHLAAVFLLLSTTLTVAKLTAHRISESLAQPLESIDRQIAGFTGIDNPPETAGVLRALLSDSYLSRTYRRSSLQADLFIAFYAQQRAGESMHSPKHCLPGSGWEIWNYGSTEIPFNGSNVEVNNYSISRDGQRMLVLYWYQSKHRVIASEYLGKILLARDALLQNSTSGSIVRIIVPDQPGALDDARALASELIPQVQRCFGR